MARAVMSISLSPELAQRVEAEAQRQESKVSTWAAEAFENYLERKEEGRSGNSEN